MIKRIIASPEEFYRRSLFGPYLILVFAIPLTLTGELGGPFPILSFLAAAVAGIFLLGAIPHLAIAIPLTFWMRRQSRDVMRKTLLLLPLLVVALSIPYFMAFTGWKWADPYAWRFLMTDALTLLVLGYAWVGLVLGIGRWLEKRGKFLNMRRRQPLQVHPVD